MKTSVFSAEWVDRWFGGEEPPRGLAGESDFSASDPLQRDRESRYVRGPHRLRLVAKNPPRQESFGSFHPQGYYVYSLKLPDELFREEQVRELSSWIRGLNAYLERPITDFTWNQPDHAYYSVNHHQVTLRPEWHVSPSERVKSAKSSLTHEMMHGVFHTKGFEEDSVWRAIYHLSLAERNYEIFDDSNYFEGRSDYFGHPNDNASEAFASAGAAYYYRPEVLAGFIAHPRTPESMRLVGKAAWCFMRERVFDGKVFTADGVDPLAGESLKELMVEISWNERDALWSAFLGSDEDAVEPSRRALAALFAPDSRAAGLEYASEAVQRKILADFDGELPHLLLEILEEEGAAGKAEALETLLEEHYADLPEEILEACLRLLKWEEAPGLRILALGALGKIRELGAPEIDNRIVFAFLESLEDPDPWVRAAAERELRGADWGDLQAEVDAALSQRPAGFKFFQGLTALFVRNIGSKAARNPT